MILRSLTVLDNEGAGAFFGEPEFDTADLLRVGPTGEGTVSVLELPAVQDRPRLFSTFLMWLLADLYQELPEVGDLDRPKLVFFFDEAHLLFKDASKAFLEAITQTVRLIRSKGWGSSSSPSRRRTCRATCWPSWGTGCSTRCGPSPRTTPRR